MGQTMASYGISSRLRKQTEGVTMKPSYKFADIQSLQVQLGAHAGHNARLVPTL
jgi:hypothetical protein